MSAFHRVAAAFVMTALGASLAQAQVNLQIREFKLAQTRVGPGEQINFTAKVRNSGSRSLASANWAIFLSTDRNISSGDSLRLTGTVTRLAPFVTRSISGTFTIPKSWKNATSFAGLFIDWDNKVRETNEGDNTQAITLNVRGVPDLVVHSARVLTTLREAGKDFEIEVTVGNIGNLTAGSLLLPVRVAAFFGGDSTPRSDDIFMGSASMIVPAPFGRVTKTIKQRVPSHLRGKFSVHVIADFTKTFTEQSENNNVKSLETVIAAAQIGNNVTMEWLPQLRSMARTPNFATMRAPHGGSTNMRVFAPAFVGGTYLCFWACTARPISDACTEISLGLVNTRIMPQWLGTIRPSGIGAPGIFMPKIPPMNFTVFTHAFVISQDRSRMTFAARPAELQITRF